MSKIGRPTKLTPAVHRRVVEALASGCYRETAAQVAGVHVATLYRWLEQGEADIEHDKRTAYRDLREAIEKAEADAEQDALEIIRQSAPKNWQAAAWLLERKNPKRWGRRDFTELTHSGEVKQTVELHVPDDNARRREVAKLLQARGALNGHGPH